VVEIRKYEQAGGLVVWVALDLEVQSPARYLSIGREAWLGVYRVEVRRGVFFLAFTHRLQRGAWNGIAYLKGCKLYPSYLRGLALPAVAGLEPTAIERVR
jgi:hypothetical protein